MLWYFKYIFCRWSSIRVFFVIWKKKSADVRGAHEGSSRQDYVTFPSHCPQQGRLPLHLLLEWFNWKHEWSCVLDYVSFYALYCKQVAANIGKTPTVAKGTTVQFEFHYATAELHILFDQTYFYSTRYFWARLSSVCSAANSTKHFEVQNKTNSWSLLYNLIKCISGVPH